MGPLAGDTARGRGGRKDAKQESTQLAGQRDFILHQHLLPSFYGSAPATLRPEHHPHIPSPSCRNRHCWVPQAAQCSPSHRLHSCRRGCPTADMVLLVTGWSQTQERDQHISRELSITSGRTALVPKAARVPGPMQRAPAGLLQSTVLRQGGVSFKPVIRRLTSQVQCVSGVV